MIFIATVALTIGLIIAVAGVGEPRGDIFMAAAAIVIIIGICADNLCDAIRERR